MLDRVKGAWGVVGKVVFAIVATMVLMGSNCHPQMPIGVKPGSAVWVTIHDRDSSRIVGYVLVTGIVEQQAPLATTKGVFAVESMTEHWFAANNEDLIADPEELRAIKWNVQAAAGNDWREEIRGYIDHSEALVDTTEPMNWDLRAPSGAVAWEAPSSSPLAGVSAFEHTARDGVWQLGMALTDGALSRVVWASPQQPGEYTLPNAFTKAGSMTLERIERASPLAVFDDHEVASP